MLHRIQLARMLSAATREEQATACLEAAEHYRAPLLALAAKLTGSAEEGMNLFQETVLNCHDAIQRNGFAGEKYQFYLYTALHNQFKRQKRRGGRELAVDFQALDSPSGSRNDEGSAPWASKVRRQSAGLELGSAPLAPAEERAQLAEQIQAEAQQRFDYADRLLLRLSIDGYSSRDIAQMTGKGDHTTIWRRLERMKNTLRATFRQAWETLAEPE